uniref:AT3G52170-like helix-turn-helix domain-containing protein n=1 Tax=Aegilops tauschii TaxID=37682 RepID=R7W8P0_AEGTA
MQATGSVTWVVGAQASVLGRCSGGVPYPSSSSSASSGRYRVSNNGKFPSVNLTHKEVGGSYYIVREIMRDIIQENRVLGPGDLNAKTLSFEDCPDSSELSNRHELGQDNIEILDMSDGYHGNKDYVLEMSDKDEAFSLQTNFISTQQLPTSSDILESGILNSVLQNGNVADATCLEPNLEKQDEAFRGKPSESQTNSSEMQAPSLAHVSDLHKEIELNNAGDEHEETTSSITDEVTPSPEHSVSQTNGALLHEHVTSPDDCDVTTNTAVDEAIVCSENGVLQTDQILIQEHEIVPETASIKTEVVQISDGHFRSATPATQMDAYTSNTSAATVESAVSIDHHDVVEQPLLGASPNEQQKSEDLASRPAMDTKGFLQKEYNHNTVEKDENWEGTAEERGQPILAYRKGICCFYVQVVGKMSDGRNASSSGTAWDVFLPTRKREAPFAELRSP